MADFISSAFLRRVKKKGRLLDALDSIESMSAETRSALTTLPERSAWECVLEEVIDADHEPEYYLQFVNELLNRGYEPSDIRQMRMIVWETAGWFNFEMMAWDWCNLDRDDMLIGLENRLDTGDISDARFLELSMLIEKYDSPARSAAYSVVWERYDHVESISADKAYATMMLEKENDLSRSL